MKNDFYVYVHKRKDNDVVFYVGKGRGQRSNVATDRSFPWQDIVKSAGGFIVNYLKTGLSEIEAVTLENEYIKNPLKNWKLVNINSASVVTKLSREYLVNYFEYDPESPSGLVWKINKGRKIKAGDIAGSLTKGNRWQVCINGKTIFVHRIIASIHNLELDQNVVDHIDGNSSNNLITNLRCIPQSQNTRNTGVRSTNKCGVCGVRYSSHINSWRAEWCNLDGNTGSKSFSCKKYGQEQAFALACQWREQKIKELNEQGAGYTERHGK